MKLFNRLHQLLQENLDDEIEIIKRHPTTKRIVDRRKVGNYTLLLIEGNYGMGFQVSFVYGDQKFTEPTSQMKLPAKDSLLKHMREIENIFREWMTEYGTIMIGSFNSDKTEIYKKIFSKRFDTSYIQYVGNMGSFFTMRLK